MLDKGQLRIRIAIVRVEKGVEKAVSAAVAVLTPLPEEGTAGGGWVLDGSGRLGLAGAGGVELDCHTTRRLAVRLPPGDTGVCVGDQVRFGDNRFGVQTVKGPDLVCGRVA